MRSNSFFFDDYGLRIGWFVASIVLAIAIVVGGAVGLTAWSSSSGCSNRWSGYETRSTFTGGCVVEFEGRWLSEDRIIVPDGTIRIEEKAG